MDIAALPTPIHAVDGIQRIAVYPHRLRQAVYPELEGKGVEREGLVGGPRYRKRGGIAPVYQMVLFGKDKYDFSLVQKAQARHVKAQYLYLDAVAPFQGICPPVLQHLPVEDGSEHDIPTATALSAPKGPRTSPDERQPKQGYSPYQEAPREEAAPPRISSPPQPYTFGPLHRER